jgi:hypothetical protein
MLRDSRGCIVILQGLRAVNKQATTKHMMKLGGFLLLLSGWGIVLAALVLLHGPAVGAFVYAGLGVEIIGMVLVFRGHLPEGEESK